MKSSHFLLATFALSTLLTGCHWWPEFGIPANKKMWGEFNPIQSMNVGPAYRDQQPGGMLYPAVGSQPMNYSRDGYAKSERDKAKELINPLEPTKESIELGKTMYNTTCITCHGPQGNGDGLVMGEDKFNVKLPNFHDQRLIDLSDGEFFHTITHGYGLMFSYKSQLQPMERWAVINYIRVLQKAGK